MLSLNLNANCDAYLEWDGRDVGGAVLPYFLIRVFRFWIYLPVANARKRNVSLSVRPCVSCVLKFKISLRSSYG